MSDDQKLQLRGAETREAALRRHRAAPSGPEPAVQRMLNRRPAAQRQADLQQALAGSPRVLALQAMRDRLGQTGAAPGSGQHAVVQRMTLSEYDQAVRQNDGTPIEDLLEAGYAEYLDLSGKTASDEGRLAWRNARAREIIAYLGTVSLDRFTTNPGARQAVEMVIGGIGRGKSLLLPPNPESMADTDLLFRGTTLDTSTNALYVGSGGSAHGSPTTPSAVAAALFATKSATENQAPGRIVYGPIGNVRTFGFAPPDVMSGQEQEITVARAPEATNEALGSVLPVELFRRALRLIGVHVPESLTAGQAFDDRLERAARNPLRPDQRGRLQTLLSGDPQANVEQWEALMLSTDRLQGTVAERAGVLGRMRGVDTSGARAVAGEIETRLQAARDAPTLEAGLQALAEAAARLVHLDQAIEALTSMQAASSSQDVAEEDFDLFDQ